MRFQIKLPKKPIMNVDVGKYIKTIHIINSNIRMDTINKDNGANLHHLLDELIDIRQSQQPLVEDVEKILLEKAFNTNPANREIFQKIRTDTGVSDVNEIVHKFLTRE